MGAHLDSLCGFALLARKRLINHVFIYATDYFNQRAGLLPVCRRICECVCVWSFASPI